MSAGAQTESLRFISARHYFTRILRGKFKSRRRQRRLRLRRNHLPGWFEARSVTRTIPCFLRLVPTHDTSHVWADGGSLVHGALGITIGRELATFRFHNHSGAAFQFPHRIRFRTLQAILNKIIRIIFVLFQIVPEYRAPFFDPQRRVPSMDFLSRSPNRVPSWLRRCQRLCHYHKIPSR